MRDCLFAASISFLWLLSAAAPAEADVAPPGVEECHGREAGETCTIDGQPGVCQESTCSGNDYSDGPPPRVVEYACRLCVATGAPPSVPPPGSGRGCAVGVGRSATPALLGALALALLLGRRAR